MNAEKKIKNTRKFSKVVKFILYWFHFNKIFLIDINKYFWRFKDALIIVQIQNILLDWSQLKINLSTLLNLWIFLYYFSRIHLKVIAI